MYQRTGNDVQVSEAFKKSLKEEFTGMLWATLRADPWTKKTLENGLNPALAAKASNAIQKYAVENTRLGIPMFLAEECPHGHMAIGATVFPTPIGQASTWNPELIQKMAAAIAEETRLQGAHVGYGPVLDLAREPRWSRVEETYGEDPVLNAKMGVAVVKGFQGRNINSGINVISTLKHFAAYGAPEGGHNGGSISVGMRSLQQDYLPPFKAAVQAGALSMMTAYNSIDGIPCSSNPVLLKDILRNDWGFNGFVVSDLNSISGLVNNHHVANTADEAAALAINAGLDADLSGTGYGQALVKAVKSGKVSEVVLDTAVARLLRLKFEMGLFEHPYVDPAEAVRKVQNAEKIALARAVAKESIILLKNERNLLPLSKQIKTLAVIGPNADNMYNQLGDYTAPQKQENIITVLKGIREKVGKDTKILYNKGTAIRDTSLSTIKEAINLAQQADATVVVLGGSSARDFKTSYEATGAAAVSANKEGLSDMESGEGFDRATLDLMGDQLKLLQALQKTGKPIILVLIEGRPLNINWAKEHIPAILNAWYPGQEGGNAIADVLFGDYNPAGRLPVSVPKSVGQLPVYYNMLSPQRRDYVEIDAKPLYSFGFGLSYTTFKYANLAIKKAVGDEQLLTVTFNLENTGSVKGEEVSQLYIQPQSSSVVLPVKQLKAFKKIELKPGEKRQVVLELTKADLAIFNNENKWVIEPGLIHFMIGSASDHILLKADYTLE